jgi:hypothetical protein
VNFEQALKPIMLNMAVRSERYRTEVQCDGIAHVSEDYVMLAEDEICMRDSFMTTIIHNINRVTSAEAPRRSPNLT